MKILIAALFTGLTSPALAQQFISGSKAEIILVSLLNAGAHIDCRMGHCGVHAIRVVCNNEGSCDLAVKVQSGEFLATRLSGESAADLGTSIYEGDSAAIHCLFPRSPDEPASNTQCLIED